MGVSYREHIKAQEKRKRRSTVYHHSTCSEGGIAAAKKRSKAIAWQQSSKAFPYRQKATQLRMGL